MLSKVGSRCWIRIKAMPLPADKAPANFRQASRPPAEAPIPTIEKSLPSLGNSGARGEGMLDCGGGDPAEYGDDSGIPHSCSKSFPSCRRTGIPGGARE